MPRTQNFAHSRHGGATPRRRRRGARSSREIIRPSPQGRSPRAFLTAQGAPWSRLQLPDTLLAVRGQHIPTEDRRGVLQQIRLPGRHLGRMDLVVRRDLRHRLLTPDRLRGHSRLERRLVVSSWFLHGYLPSSCYFALTDFHLHPCPKNRSYLCQQVDLRNISLNTGRAFFLKRRSTGKHLRVAKPNLRTPLASTHFGALGKTLIEIFRFPQAPCLSGDVQNQVIP